MSHLTSKTGVLGGKSSGGPILAASTPPPRSTRSAIGRGRDAKAGPATAACRMQARIFRDIKLWHDDYRQKVREARQSRSLAISKLRPGDPPPPPVQDAMLGLQDMSAAEERCFMFFIGSNRARFTVKYAAMYRSKKPSLLNFQAESEETVELCERLNAFVAIEEHSNITQLWRTSMDRTVHEWLALQEQRAKDEAVHASSAILSRVSSLGAADNDGFPENNGVDGEMGPVGELPPGGAMLIREFSSMASSGPDAPTAGAARAASDGLGGLGTVGGSAGASGDGAGLLPVPLLRGNSMDGRGEEGSSGAALHGGAAGGAGLFGDGADSGGEALLRGLSTDASLAAAGGRSMTGVYKEVWGRLPTSTSMSGVDDGSGLARPDSLESTSSSGIDAPVGIVRSSLSRLQYQTPAAAPTDGGDLTSPEAGADTVGKHPLVDEAAYKEQRRRWRREQSKQLRAKRCKEAVKRELLRLLRCRDKSDDGSGGGKDDGAEAGGSAVGGLPQQRAYELVSLGNPFAWEVRMHFGKGTALGRQLRERAEALGLPRSSDPRLADDPLREHAHLRLLVLFPLEFPKDPPVVRLVGPMLEEGTGCTQFGALVSPLLYGPTKQSAAVEDDVDADKISLRNGGTAGISGDGLGDLSASSPGGVGASGRTDSPLTPAAELWGGGGAAGGGGGSEGGGGGGRGGSSPVSGEGKEEDNLAALLSGTKRRKNKKKKKKGKAVGSNKTATAGAAASRSPSSHDAWASAKPQTPQAAARSTPPPRDIRQERRDREEREFNEAMAAYRALEQGAHDKILVALLRALRKQLTTTSGGGVELPAARVRTDTAAVYDPDAWAAVHRRLTKDWGEYELSTRGDFRDTVIAQSGTHAMLHGLRFPASFQGGDKLITGPGIPIEMGGGSRSLELTPLSSTGAVAIGTYAGILQSNAPRGSVVIPDHLMRSMGLSDGDRVSIRTVELHKVKGLRLRPARADWHKRVPIPQMPFLRTAMQRFSSLTRGQMITLRVTADDFESTPRYAEALQKVGGVAEEVFLAETLDPDEPMVKLWDGFFTNVKVDFLPAADAEEYLERVKKEAAEREMGSSGVAADGSGPAAQAQQAASGAGADGPPAAVSRLPWGVQSDPATASKAESDSKPELLLEQFLSGQSVSVSVLPSGAASGAGASSADETALKVRINGGNAGDVMLQCQGGVTVADVIGALSPFVEALAEWRGQLGQDAGGPGMLPAVLSMPVVGGGVGRPVWKGTFDAGLELLCPDLDPESKSLHGAGLAAALGGSRREALSLRIDWPAHAAAEADGAASSPEPALSSADDIRPLAEYLEVLVVGVNAPRTHSSAGTNELARCLRQLARGTGQAALEAEGRAVDARVVRNSTAIHVSIPRDEPVKRDDARDKAPAHGPREFPDDDVVPRSAVYLRFPADATAADLHAAVERALEPVPVPCQIRVARQLPDMPGAAFEQSSKAGLGGVRVQGGERGAVIHDDALQPLQPALGSSHSHVSRGQGSTSASLFLRSLASCIEELPGSVSTTAKRLRAGSRGVYVVEQVPAPLTASVTKTEEMKEQEAEQRALQRWTCPVCTGVNRAWQTECSVCHSARPAGDWQTESARKIVQDRLAAIRREHRLHDPRSMSREVSASSMASFSSMNPEQGAEAKVTTVAVGAERLALDDKEDVPWLRWALAGGHLLPEELAQLDASWIREQSDIQAF